MKRIITNLRKNLLANVLLSSSSLVAATVLSLGGCGGASAKDPAMPPDQTTSTPAPAAEPGEPAEPADTSAAVPPPIAKSRAELARHEGKPLRVEGTFRFPAAQAFARLTLVLDDGTVVILPPPDEAGPGAKALADVNDGRRMVISGVVYLDQIPAQYGVVSRTPDPYLFELSAATLLK